MDTDELVSALDPLQPAHLACAAALHRGAPFTLWLDGVATPDELLDICRRRHRKVVEQGIETLGFDRALKELESTSHEQLRLGAVEDPSYHYAVFLAADQPEVVACLGVGQSFQESDSSGRP